MAANVSCGFTTELEDFKNRILYLNFSYLPAFYFLIGVSTRTLSLIAFYKQYKKEKAFAYQIISAIIEMLEIIMTFLYLISKNNLAGGLLRPGVMWYKQNYPLMVYASNFCVPIFHGCITSSLLISVSMTADRAFSLAKPYYYKNINHRRHQDRKSVV